MSLKSANKHFDKIQQAYIFCVKEALEKSLKQEWGQDWFKRLKSLDKKHTDAENEKNKMKAAAEGKESKQIPYMLDKCNNVRDMDFQACSKILFYLKDVRHIVFKYYGREEYVTDYKLSGKYEHALKGLIWFRNQFIGHKTYEKEVDHSVYDEHVRAIDNIYILLRDVFSTIINKEDSLGRTYAECVEEARLAFHLEASKKQYILSELLDKRTYDYGLFFEECAKLGIEAEYVDGKYIFYSSNIEGDLARLKNSLRKQSDAVYKKMEQEAPRVKTQATATAQPVVAPQPKQAVDNRRKSSASANTFIRTIVILLVMAMIVAIGPTFFDRFLNRNTYLPEQNGNGFTQDDNQGDSQDNGADSNVVGDNEVPEQFQAEIESFEYMDKGQKDLSTLTISVGEGVTPMPASVWTNCIMYSANTGVVTIEGKVVKGVAPGATYVVIQADPRSNMVDVFKIIVTN